jgi:serine/threonine protein kinase
MKPRTSNASKCQPDQLEDFLNGQLTSRDEQLLLVHLNECDNCRRQLDESAATPDSLNAAYTFLRDDENNRASIGKSRVGDTSNNDEDLAASPQIKQVIDILNPTDDPAMLGRLGGYEVSGIVGAGGMGVVLKAFDRPLDRTVAIKVLAPHLAMSGAARQRFSREARAAAAVIHPNVIAIYGVSTDAALPFLMMPYVGGSSLQKRLDSEGALPVVDILRISLQIASGLAAAHHQGLVHRDIKPANILLGDGVDRLVITDFGLARAADDASVTRTGVIAGTPQYMSPEQARGEPVDARSDLFSLGSVMYTMCTGRVPFRAESPYGVLRRITDNEPRDMREINPDGPVWLCRIVNRLHSKSASDRFASADELSALLSECLAHIQQPTLHGLPSQLAQRQRVSRSVLVTGLVAASLLAGFYWLILRPPRADSPFVATTNPTAEEVQAAPEILVPDATEPVESGTQAVDPSRDSREIITEEGAPTPDSDIRVIKPWDDPFIDATSWDDQLDGVFKHVEQSLKQI